MPTLDAMASSEGCSRAFSVRNSMTCRTTLYSPPSSSGSRKRDVADPAVI
jgi:hypothetical protein